MFAQSQDGSQRAKLLNYKHERDDVVRTNRIVRHEEQNKLFCFVSV